MIVYVSHISLCEGRRKKWRYITQKKKNWKKKNEKWKARKPLVGYGGSISPNYLKNLPRLWVYQLVSPLHKIYCSCIHTLVKGLNMTLSTWLSRFLRLGGATSLWKSLVPQPSNSCVRDTILVIKTNMELLWWLLITSKWGFSFLLTVLSRKCPI